MELQGKKVAVLIENGFHEPEIWYYTQRFPEEGMEVHFLTRLWGQESLTFNGSEYRAPLECRESFEDIDDEALRGYSAVIVPGGLVADRLRYTEDINKTPPAVEFIKRAFVEKSILKGIICHGMWLMTFTPELIRGRKVVAPNNFLGDVRNMGAIYTDEDVVVDGDLVTARTSDHCNVFVRMLIRMMAGR
jgi:protease I